MSLPLPQELKQFVSDQEWIFAKTYAKTWPHEYIVRDRVDQDLFLQLVSHIREHGYQGHFYSKPITYFDEAGMVYWTMGAPVDETTIINRCSKEQSYEYRRDHGTLPEDVAKQSESPDVESDASGPSTLPCTMGPLRHPEEVAKVVDVCALRFLGYEYENAIPQAEKHTQNLSAWSQAICNTLALHADPMRNFAAFFALQRSLGKWCGVSMTIYSEQHIAFDFLFLHLYTQDVPTEHQHADYMRQWEAIPKSEIESAAAYIRQSFCRRQSGPKSLHELVQRLPPHAE